MKVREALGEAAARLSAVSDTPRLDAELLMARAFGVERGTLLLSMAEDDAPESFAMLADRRASGEPVAYITGRRAFWTIELAVAPGVLIPRPDSETLIEAAVAHFGDAQPSSVLDLGTGSGALLLAALDQWPDARGLGVDLSEQALAIASANAERLGMARRASFRHGDWAAGLEDSFDLVLCNPPYVEAEARLPAEISQWEPAQALYAGPDGMDEYRRLAPVIGALLRPGGIACLEIGAGQADQVTRLLEDRGLSVARHRDLGGHVRCLSVWN